MTRRLPILGAIGALSLFALPAVAGATVFCVPNNAIDGSCQTPEGDVQSALDAAEANTGDDTVRIGSGTFSAADISGFRYEAGNGKVSIIGAGEAQTTLTHPPDPGGAFHINNILFWDGSGAGSSISNLTAAIPVPVDNTFTSQHRAIEVRAATIDHVTVTEPGGTNINSYGFWVDPGSTTIDNSTVNFPSPGGQDAVITNSSGDVHIEDSTLTARAGVVLRAPGLSNSIKRSMIRITGSANGVDAQDGALDLESSLIDLGATGAAGVRSTGSVSANDVTLNLDHATIVGTNSGAEGLQVQANDATQADSIAATLTNSVISGPGTAIRRSSDNGDTATVTSSYSNYDAAGNVSSNGTSGAGTLTETHQTNLPPGFVNPGAGDYHLTSSSQLIDRGDPTALFAGELDIDGGARALEGPDGVCPSASDIGADEFAGTPLLDCLPPDTSIDTGPSGTTTEHAPTFTFSATEVGATFECSLDGAPFSSCTSPVTTPTLADGPHTFAIQATDTNGNLDPSPATRSFTVTTPSAPDTAPPDTSIGSHPKPKTKSRKASFSFSSTEPGSTFVCSFDSKPYSPCSGSFTTPKLKPGKHRFDVIATDSAGNRDQSAATFLWKITKRKRR